jgi:hypothetical protein
LLLAAAGIRRLWSPREERPPEQWLVKAWDGPVLVDLIHEPAGMAITDEVISRGERLSVEAMGVQVWRWRT